MMIRYWFTITQAAVATLLVTAPAGAVSSKMLNDTAFELTAGYQCEKVLKDKRPYRTAKRKAGRHTAATRAVRASNLRVVQKLFGHEDTNTTKNAHAMVEDIRSAMEAMNMIEDRAGTKKVKKAQRQNRT
ncbi:hypothetical protein ACLBWS_01360 [Brucellaceae bacterium D45D]